ncbi:MAG: AMP-dependent synthetase [Deltaproteobacteria bacterium]|nr:MAG: AMP-dependent synthetase [Deltaproteobacteria bacterium]
MLVHHFLEDSAGRLPDKTALICGDKRFTYRQINELSDRLAGSLINMGAGKQDRVLILMDNSVESIISLFGILKAGCIFVMLSATMKPKKIRYILKDTGAEILITHGNKSRVLNEVVRDPVDLKQIIWAGKSSNLPLPSTIESRGFDAIIADTQVYSSSGQNAVIDVDLATLIYTSGSTGEPKGVMSAHYNMVSAVKSITHYLENVEDDIILNVLPLSFDYGLYQVLMAFFKGCTVVLEKSFVYPYKIMERLVKERVTGFPIVPTMVAILLQMEKISSFDFSALRYISNTAAALPVAYIRKIQKIFPQTKIFSMYGLTECKRVSYLPPALISSRPESVGIPIPNEEVFIVDGDGNSLGPDKIGELVVRGSNVMQGYWNAPEATAKMFRPGRYRGDVLLYTGDLFKKDEEGFLYFVSRKDDMIKTKGERVSPKEIENVLCEMDGILEAAVIGVPDDIFGQAIKAFVVGDQKINLTKQQVVKYCTRNLEPFMVPKYVEFQEEFLKSDSGKIDKKVLQA